MRDFDIFALAVSPQNPNLAYVGSSKAIYRTDNGGRIWQKALTLKGSDKGVNFLIFNRANRDIIYAATKDGLLRVKSFSPDTWEKIFSGVGGHEKDCVCVLAEGEKIFLGTKSGLFISADAGKSWRKASGELGNSAIIYIEVFGERVFVVTSDKLFASRDNGENFRRIFSLGLRQGSAESEEEESSTEESDDGLEEERSGISALFIDKEAPDKIYLAATNGLLLSVDNGRTFSAVNNSGLGSVSVRNIVSQAGDLYVSTAKGVFWLTKDGETWQNLYEGVLTQDARFIAFDSLERLWVATSKGIFRNAEPYGGSVASPDKFSQWKERLGDEPAISEVQNAAIKYAEVIDPAKIRDLRKGARLKALIPDIDLDYEKTVSSYSGGNFYIGPQDWSLGLSWDLGDLVWSDQQRLIDSQARLMVELRDDILTEVTRLYFERRRLQAELLTSPALEPKLKLEKELRLEELTASIDALTGNYFSKELSGGKN